jgi:predicted lipopolysaccharide heptosyltransferase III
LPCKRRGDPVAAIYDRRTNKFRRSQIAAVIVNIILLQLKRIGDLILTTPAIHAVRDKFPEATLTLIVSREAAALLPAIEGVDRTLILERKLSDLRIYHTVTWERFDYCIDFTRNDRSALLTSLSRAKKRIMAPRVRNQSRLNASAYNELLQHRMHEMHTIDYNLALLGPLGIRDATAAIRLQLPSSALEQAEEIRRSFKIDDPFIIFHPGSAWSEKFWDAQRWARTIKHARTASNVVITGGTSQPELKHIAEIKSKLSGTVVDLSGKTDLLALAALIAQARLVVTVDSAPMHLAAAMKTPQVVLFGPTNPFHWRPRENTALILQGRSASPLVRFSHEQAGVPMNDISTEAVINAMDSLLSAPAAPAS